MSKINLLPWRAERRKVKQKQFYSALGIAAVVAVLAVIGVIKYFDALLENQNARNTYLQNEINILDVKIKEIEALDRKKASLLRRKQVIEELQASRSQMVHLFDELVRTIPDGVRLGSIKQAGAVMTLEGVTQSNTRVSSYMRSLEKSGWMSNPDLDIIKVQDKSEEKGMPYQFVLKVNMVQPKVDVGADGSAATSSAKTGGAQ